MLPTERKPPASDIPEPLRQDRAEHLLDSHEAAAMLKVRPRTLQRLAQRGEIAGVQVGKTVAIPRFLYLGLDRQAIG